jgi:hypothetical protein
LLVALVPATAFADTAFCELTPCVKDDLTRSIAAADTPVGKVVCKKGKDIAHDQQKRVRMCTTATAVVVDGIPYAKAAYTLFHANGRVYQTHAGAKFDRTQKDGSKVTCGPALIALEEDGHVRYCKLAAKRVGTPQAKVGEGISFHPDGRVSGMTLDEPYAVAGLALIAGASVYWDLKGAVIGGYVSDPITAGSLTIAYEFQLHGNGKLKVVTLRKPAKIGGHEFPDFAKVAFRDDGSLEAAEYVAKRGFMIHGEPWTDTRHMTFDRANRIATDRTEHYQAKEGPGKFRPKKP